MSLKKVIFQKFRSVIGGELAEDSLLVASPHAWILNKWWFDPPLTSHHNFLMTGHNEISEKYLFLRHPVSFAKKNFFVDDVRCENVLMMRMMLTVMIMMVTSLWLQWIDCGEEVISSSCYTGAGGLEIQHHTDNSHDSWQSSSKENTVY